MIPNWVKFIQILRQVSRFKSEAVQAIATTGIIEYKENRLDNVSKQHTLDVAAKRQQEQSHAYQHVKSNHEKATLRDVTEKHRQPTSTKPNNSRSVPPPGKKSTIARGSSKKDPRFFSHQAEEKYGGGKRWGSDGNDLSKWGTLGEGLDYKPGMLGMPLGATEPSYLPGTEKGFWTALGLGAEHGIEAVRHGIFQAAARADVILGWSKPSQVKMINNEYNQENAMYQNSAFSHSWGGEIGNIGGQIIGYAPLALAGGAELGTISFFMESAASGAAVGYLQPTYSDTITSHMESAGTSAMLGITLGGGLSLAKTGLVKFGMLGGTKGDVFNSGGDRLLETMGPARLSHPEEYEAILSDLKANNVDISFRDNQFAYGPASGSRTAR